MQKPATATVTREDPTSGAASSDGATDESTDAVMARRRRAVIIGLGVLAVLQAADVKLTWELLANNGSELNPVGRVLIGTGAAIFAKFSVLAVLLALALSRRPVRLGFVCGVWAVTGIYVAVVAINFYSLHLVGGLS